MGSGNLAGDVDAHGYGKSPAKRDVGEAAMNGLAGVAGRKQHDHRNNADTKQHEHQGAEEFGDQLGCQRGLWVHWSSPGRQGRRRYWTAK